MNTTQQALARGQCRDAHTRSSPPTLFANSKLWNSFLAFVGWMLSPATWWNDAFVNIPTAYGSASVVAWFWPKAFLAAFVVGYWGTNVLGSWMLLVSGRTLLQKRITPQRQKLFTALTIIYCIVMSILILKDLAKPIAIPHQKAETWRWFDAGEAQDRLEVWPASRQAL